WSFFRSLFGGCKHDLQRSFDKYAMELTTDDYGIKSFKTCEKKVSKKWFTSARKKRVLIQACLVNSHQKSADRIARELPLWRLKDFLQDLWDESAHKQDIYSLFGVGQVFSYGSLSAQTREGLPFQAYF